MQEKVTRDQMFYWLRLFGEDLPREQWEEGERAIGAFIAQQDEEIAKLKGAIPLPFDVSPI